LHRRKFFYRGVERFVIWIEKVFLDYIREEVKVEVCEMSEDCLLSRARNPS
jgi:hypothetical protein